MSAMFFKIQITWLLAGAITISLAGCDQQTAPAEATETAAPAAAAPEQEPARKADKTKLVGDWERTDAPYQIRISELLADGTMEAGYFNPGSINIGKATWVADQDILKVYIELRDVNYPGSNYTLTYFVRTDMLAGKYYQAVEGATYDVSFTRRK